MTGFISFTTDAFAEHERFSAFCDEVVRRYTCLDFNTRDRSRFHASLRLQRAGAIAIGANTTSEISSARTTSLVRDGDDSILVTLVRQGFGFQTQRSGDQRLAPGDAVICDCAYAGELNFIADATFWNLKIPRQKLVTLVPGLVNFAGARLDRDETARRLLFGCLDGAFGVDLSGAERSGQLHENHVLGLVALALGAEEEARRTVEEGGVKAVRRAAILREIALFFADPNLSVVTVAARLGITARYAHVLLAETGRTFSEHLLAVRLERAAALLRAPRQQFRRIGSIAFACGFRDLSHFNRVFRRRYGATPSDLREASRREQT